MASFCDAVVGIETTTSPSDLTLRRILLDRSLTLKVTVPSCSIFKDLEVIEYPGNILLK
jgi:hypothetical protein